MVRQKNRRDIAFVTAVAIGISSYFIFWRQHPSYFFKGLIVLSVLIFIMGMLSDYFATQFLKYWLWVGKTIGRINAYLILTVFYFIIITPYGFLRKLFSQEKSFLEKRVRSQYSNRNYKYVKADFEKLW
jgi:hypothetical protein